MHHHQKNPTINCFCKWAFILHTLYLHKTKKDLFFSFRSVQTFPQGEKRVKKKEKLFCNDQKKLFYLVHGTNWTFFCTVCKSNVMYIQYGKILFLFKNSQLSTIKYSFKIFSYWLKFQRFCGLPDSLSSQKLKRCFFPFFSIVTRAIDRLFLYRNQPIHLTIKCWCNNLFL